MVWRVNLRNGWHIEVVASSLPKAKYQAYKKWCNGVGATPFMKFLGMITYVCRADREAGKEESYGLLE